MISYLDDFGLLGLDLIGLYGCIRALDKIDSRWRSYGVYVFLLLYFAFAFVHDLTFFLDPNVVLYRQMRISVVRILMVAAAWYGALLIPYNDKGSGQTKEL